MKNSFLTLPLIAFALLIVGNSSLTAQVVFDNNLATETTSFNAPATEYPDINNFMVPQGNDRLLVVIYSSSASNGTPFVPIQLSYGSTNLQLAKSIFPGNDLNNQRIYYALLGSGDAISNNITISGGFQSGGFIYSRGINAFTLQNVDQANPIEAMDSQTFDMSPASSLTLAGTTIGSMILEVQLFAKSITPESGQEVIPNTVSSLGLSLLSSPGGDISPMWENGITETAAAISFAVASEPIPTMGQWSLFILSLLLLSLGIVHVQRRELA